MSAAARSVFVFGLYLMALGVVLLFAPNMLLGAFGMPSTTEVWIRVVGMLVLVIGFLDVVAGRTELVPLFRASVLARGLVPVVFGAFVIEGWAPVQLLLFGAVDLAGAVWTAVALRRAG